MEAKNVYLLAYNAVSLSLWGYLTILTIPKLLPSELGSLYGLLSLLTVTQSLAVLEILHAATSLVRASPLTTAIQVVGKNLVVWTVMRRFPDLVTGTYVGRLGFAGCLVCWGLSEVLRYGYFVVLLLRGQTGDLLQWARYVLL